MTLLEQNLSIVMKETAGKRKSSRHFYSGSIWKHVLDAYPTLPADRRQKQPSPQGDAYVATPADAANLLDEPWMNQNEMAGMIWSWICPEKLQHRAEILRYGGGNLMAKMICSRPDPGRRQGKL